MTNVSQLYTIRTDANLAQNKTQNRATAANFADYIAKVTEGEKDVKSAAIKEKLEALPKARPEIKPANLDGVIKPSGDAIDVDHRKKYQKLIDDMMHKANQSANQMSPEGRKRVAEEFEAMSQDLIKHLQKSGLIDDSVMPIIADYIESWDISDKAGANETFNQMFNFNNYIDRLDGTYEEPPVPDEGSWGESLDELQHMANRSANHMTDAQRADLNERFEKKMNEFLDRLDESGLFQHDVVMNFMRNYMSGLDISNQQDAQRAFNELQNMETYLNSSYV